MEKRMVDASSASSVGMVDASSASRVGWLRGYALLPPSNLLRHNLHFRPCLHLRRISAYSNPGLATSMDDNRGEADPLANGNVSEFMGQHDDKWKDDKMLRMMEEVKNFLPIMRTYKNGLCTLEICGNAPRPSVLTAMASDQGFTAASNMLMGRRLTVLHAIHPGHSGVNSSVSTKLFAPTLQVVERAKGLSLPKALSNGEYLHKFFEAVQMSQLSKFYLELHVPGTIRDMSALEKEEMVQTIYSLESSDLSAIHQFGKVISLYAIAGLKRNTSGNSSRSILKNVWSKQGWIPTPRSPVRIRALSVDEIEYQVKCLKDAMGSVEEGTGYDRPDRSWWPAPSMGLETARRCLEEVSDDWIYEHVPLHRMHIDADVLEVRVVGDGARPTQPRDIILTHAQLVDLAGALETFYEDRFTLPNKSLQSGAVLDFQCMPQSKMATFRKATALGSIVIGTGIFAWLVSARMQTPSKLKAGTLVFNTMDVAVVSESELPLAGPSSEPDLPINEEISVEEMESLCKLVVTEVVKSFSWNTPVRSCAGKGAWTEMPEAESAAQICSSNLLDATPEENASEALVETKSDLMTGRKGERMEIDDAQSKEEVPLFQVVLSRDGTVLGFQPLNESAISSWAGMPFAKALHKKKKLLPGIWERPLKCRGRPKDAVLLELQVDFALSYAFARPGSL